MVHRRLVAVLTIVLLNVVAAGCVGPTTETGVFTDPAASSSSAAGISGTWHGYFVHPGTDSTSPPGNTDLTLQVREDSTYTFKLGNRPERTGTVVAKGNRVYLNDSSGLQVTLVHSGGTLHGGMKDIVPPGRVVMISLTKDEAAADRAAASRPTIRSRVCEAAGGTYSEGLCQPITTPDRGARCKARGGTYFAGGDYCEVPAGGLRSG